MDLQHHVLMVGAFEDAAVAELREVVPVTAISLQDATGEHWPELLPVAPETITGILTPGTVRFDEATLGHFENLAVLSLRSVGFDRVDVDYCARREIVVCHTPGVLDRAVAELTILLILGLARRLPANLEAAAGGWARTGTRPPYGHDLSGKVLGILGMGRIGIAVARSAHRGFGMQVIYHGGGALAGQVPPATRVERDELFRTADFVSVNVPLTDATRASIGAREFALMKPSAYIVNTSRGKVIDEDALVRALRDGVIAGAGLDVTSVEPLSASSELARRPEVLLTPHIGSATVETRLAMAELAARNLLAVLLGDPAAARIVPGTLPQHSGAAVGPTQEPQESIHSKEWASS